MSNSDVSALLKQVAEYSARFIQSLPNRPVGTRVTLEEIEAALDGRLPEGPTPASTVVEQLATAADPGILGTTSGRFFGFVIGGALPASVAADWLTSTWDQNSGLYASSPAAAMTEAVSGRWLLELLGLPPHASFGFVTGGQMANFTGLAAARHHVLAQLGWDVETRGLQGAPRVRVLANETRHDTVDQALRYLGLGTGAIEPVEADGQGRMLAESLRAALSRNDGPTIVCAQAGNVNSGAFDPFEQICELSHDVGAWVHVDGAFGLWAAVAPTRRHLVAGIEHADSWATDAHKWMNVPYDSGVAFCAHPDSHRAAMSLRASYLIHGHGSERDQMDWTPEFSRRARGFTVYAAIRTLGRQGIIDMVERCCDHARAFAEMLRGEANVEILNDVVLNQVLVRFLSDKGDHDAHTRAIVSAVQQEGTAWMSGTTWRGQAAMRFSVSNWSTTRTDIERSAAIVLKTAASL
jgi:glutamate/tyrosine decarboxylase-like PLP-dependent enzyme